MSATGRTRRASSSKATAESILSGFPPDVRELAERVRAFVRRTIPTAVEVAYVGWRGIGFRDPQSGYVCGLFPQRDHVKLGFEHGASLPDPNGLFESGGKQVRYVIFRTAADLERPGLAELVRAAVLYGAV